MLVDVDGAPGSTTVGPVDLFAPYPNDQRLLLYKADVESDVRVRLVATGKKNPLSLGSEIVLRGFDYISDDRSRQSSGQTNHTAESFAQMQSTHVDRWRAQQDDDRYAEIWFERRRRYLQRFRRASVFFGQRMLDIGCGYIFAEMLELLASLGLEYHGLDIDQRVVDHAANKLREYNVPGVIRLGEIGTATLAADAYDSVFCSHTLEHSSDLPRSLKEIYRALKPGGYLIMAVPLGWDDSEEHVHCYRSDEWIVRVRSAGFDVLSFEVAKLYDPSRYDVTIVACKPAASS